MIFELFSSVYGQQYRFDHWMVNEGLPQNSIYAIAQTPDGYLWLTTFDGLVRFDGVRFTVFNKTNFRKLPSNRFINLFAEDDGTLWVSTEGDGLVRLQNGQIRVLTKDDGLLTNSVEEVQKDLDGSLLINTTDGLMRWQNDRLSVEKIQNFREYKIYVSPLGRRWELDSKGFRRIERDGSQRDFLVPFDTQKISFDRSFNFFSYVAMLEDRTGVLWFSASGNLYRLENESLRIFTRNEGMPQSLVRGITQDAQGDIWLATEKDGACRLATNRFVCYGKEQGLTSNFIRHIFSDREGTLWFATHESGINRLSRKVVTSLSLAQGLADKNVYPILGEEQGDIWIGTTSSLSNLAGAKIKNYARQDKLLYDFVLSLAKDTTGQLWIGSIGGVEYFLNGKFTDFTEQLGLKIGEANFWDIHEDRDGALWFASTKGLLKLENGTVRRFGTENGLPTNDIRIVFERKDGSLVIGTLNGLVIMERTGELRQVLLEANGLAGNHIRSIYEDADGVLWIGTYDSGLSRFKDNKFTNYTVADGMFNNGIFAILEDSRGNFWMSSNQGIHRLAKTELNDFADGKIRQLTPTAYGKSDGMLNIECNGSAQPSALKTRDGKLWFPTQDGVAIIDPDNVPTNPMPPPVVIESALLSGKTIDFKDRLEISAAQNNLEIRYTGLSFIKPEQSQFRYRLEGLDTEWTEAKNRREAYYPYLPPGKYTFHVIAANSDNVWNEQGARLEIIVNPAFYQTWWFSAFCALAITAIVVLLYRRRVMQAHRRQAVQEEFARRLIDAHESERRRIAAELHDSLGQHLAMIRNGATFGAKISKGLKEAKSHLEKISEQSVLAIAEVREISHNLRPYILDRLGLTKGIKALLNEIKDTTDLDVNFKLEPIDGLFTAEQEISIYRIIQEGINNILKHSNATKLEIMVEKSHKVVIVRINDNGKGFSVNNSKQGFGLLGMRERVKILGGTISVDSELNKGTSILIKLNVR